MMKSIYITQELICKIEAYRKQYAPNMSFSKILRQIIQEWQPQQQPPKGENKQ